jgi:alpha-ketoglutarate-dependent taurine dioxygenase
MLEHFKKEPIFAKNGKGKIFCYQANKYVMNIIEVMESSKEEIENHILRDGGILFRGFDINSVSEFNKLAHLFCSNLFSYINRSTPRINLGGKIYTATEYPADRSIPFHNENSYSLEWPNKLLFFSIITANEGGETPIADSRKVYDLIDAKIINKFNEKKICYVRNYNKGIDLSWQEVFQTDDKKQVESYCDDHLINYAWKKGDWELKTKQVCQATIKHPITKENIWFNQAHLFHISSLKEKDRQELSSLFGKERLPRNAYYGDGMEIEENTLNIIRKAYEKERIEFIWQKGDIMILDNRLMAHSRNSFKGNRKIAVAMGD